jgi:hypothetical protein
MQVTADKSNSKVNWDWASALNVPSTGPQEELVKVAVPSLARDKTKPDGMSTTSEPLVACRHSQVESANPGI